MIPESPSMHEVLIVEHLRNLALPAASHPRGVLHLSAASGLVWHGDQIIVVADDEHHLGIFEVETAAPGRLVRVLADDLPQSAKARKQRKPDTEAVLVLPACTTWPGGALLAMGSGSRPNRQTALLIPFEALQSPDATPVLQIDLAALYAPLREHFNDLNIEGAFICGDELLLLQRGNARSPNASIAFSLPEVVGWLTALGGAASAPRALRIRHHDLGHINGVPLCFTDGAALPNGQWMFCAVAENTDNSYADGVSLGGVVGVMDADGTLRKVWSLPPALKVEGVAVRLDGEELTVLMATDADDPAQPAHLLRAKCQLMDFLAHAKAAQASPDADH